MTAETSEKMDTSQIPSDNLVVENGEIIGYVGTARSHMGQRVLSIPMSPELQSDPDLSSENEGASRG